MRSANSLQYFYPGAVGILLSGCVAPQAQESVIFHDKAPHPLPPLLEERAFDGSLFVPGGLGDLASDDVARAPGDQIVIRFDPQNGYPGIPQGEVTRLTGQVVHVDKSGSLLVAAQRTIRDSSGVRKVVLVGRVAHGSIETGNEVPVSHVSMLRFRSDGPTDKGKSPQFKGGAGLKIPKALGGLPGILGKNKTGRTP